MRNVVLFMANAPLVIAFSADTDQEKRKKANPESVFKKIVKEKPEVLMKTTGW